MIFDHVGFNVSDFARSKDFYRAALAPLGIVVVTEGEGWAMFGKPGRPAFWIGASGETPGPIHLAFAAETRPLVDQFHAAALKAGGQDNGAPGIRVQYHLNYYSAYVLDPDGHNIEAVCHSPEIAD